MARPTALILLVVTSCACATRTPRPTCSPTGEEPCGRCADPDALSPAGRARLAIDAHAALLRAEIQRQLLTGEPAGPRDRRFFTSDANADAIARTDSLEQSPGRDAEVELARGGQRLTILHFALKTRHYSRRDGVLIDVATIGRWWNGERVYEDVFNATYCVVRERDERFHIERVNEDLWSVPLAESVTNLYKGTFTTKELSAAAKRAMLPLDIPLYFIDEKQDTFARTIARLHRLMDEHQIPERPRRRRPSGSASSRRRQDRDRRGRNASLTLR
jgi:hypothetical protein